MTDLGRVSVLFGVVLKNLLLERNDCVDQEDKVLKFIFFPVSDQLSREFSISRFNSPLIFLLSGS